MSVREFVNEAKNNPFVSAALMEHIRQQEEQLKQIAETHPSAVSDLDFETCEASVASTIVSVLALNAINGNTKAAEQLFRLSGDAATPLPGHVVQAYLEELSPEEILREYGLDLNDPKVVEMLEQIQELDVPHTTKEEDFVVN